MLPELYGYITATECFRLHLNAHGLSLTSEVQRSRRRKAGIVRWTATATREVDGSPRDIKLWSRTSIVALARAGIRIADEANGALEVKSAEGEPCEACIQAEDRYAEENVRTVVHRPGPHGLSRAPEYRAWQTMRLRCMNPKNQAYADYGGRGITVCDRWKDSPENFLADMGPKPSPKHELDRIDNDRGYEPENCRWALRSVNDRNRRSNRWLEIDGVRRTLAEWSDLTGVRSDTITSRLDLGWDPARAVSAPVRRKAPNDKPFSRAPRSSCGPHVEADA